MPWVLIQLPPDLRGLCNAGHSLHCSFMRVLALDRDASRHCHSRPLSSAIDFCMTSTTHYDAIVVGSGVSGGWAAKEFTEKGL